MRVCVSLPKGKLKGDRMKELEKFLNTSGELKPGFTNRDFNMKRELIAFLQPRPLSVDGEARSYLR